MGLRSERYAVGDCSKCDRKNIRIYYKAGQECERCYQKSKYAARYQKEKEKSLAAQKNWRDSNKGHYADLQRKYRQNMTPEQKAARKASHADWCAKNPEKVTAAKKKSLEKHKQRRQAEAYGLTQEQLQQMIVDQGGICKICGGPPQAPKVSLSIDHNHKTGKVRGLLCDHCNLTLGNIDFFGSDWLLTVLNYKLDAGEPEHFERLKEHFQQC